MSKDRSILVIGIVAIMLFTILGVTLLAVSSNSTNGGGSATHIDKENIVMYDEEESFVEVPDIGIIVDSKEDEPSEPVISEPEITEPSVEEEIVEEQYEDEQEKEETSQPIEDTQSESSESGAEPTSELDVPVEDTDQKTDVGTITINPSIDHGVEIEYEPIEDLFD